MHTDNILDILLAGGRVDESLNQSLPAPVHSCSGLLIFSLGNKLRYKLYGILACACTLGTLLLLLLRKPQVRRYIIRVVTVHVVRICSHLAMHT